MTKERVTAEFMQKDHISENEFEKAFCMNYPEYARLENLKLDQYDQSLPDSTIKFLAHMKDGTTRFLLLSGSGNPQLLQRAADNIQIGRSRLSYHIAERIFVPLTSGQIMGRSFAVWDLKQPFLNQNRFRTFFNRRIYAQDIIDWLGALGQETLAPALHDVVASDLSSLIDDDGLPSDIRGAARRALDRLDSGAWTSYNCLQHGDFWQGNLLLGAEKTDPSFFVIDWAGMEMEGYPFVDLVRILMDLGFSYPVNRIYINRYCKITGMRKSEIAHYTYASLGRLRGNLEHFPLENFYKLSQSVKKFLDRMDSRWKL